ncbi:MAG: TerB family tellurite resistance protein [Acidobacteriota bacterium]
MASLLARLLGLPETTAPAAASPGAETATVRKIVDALDRMDPERARLLAAWAYILGRVAHADLDISAAETHAMERVMIERAGLPEDQAILVVQIAKSQNLLFGSTENYLVTREFSRLASREQKRALIDCLFAVSAADETVSTVEDNEIRVICQELKLDHDDFIAARTAYRDQLAVLKKKPGNSSA